MKIVQKSSMMSHVCSLKVNNCMGLFKVELSLKYSDVVSYIYFVTEQLHLNLYSTILDILQICMTKLIL